MNKTIIVILGCSMLLTGCLATTPKYNPPPLTDKQISGLNDAALCSLSNTEMDTRYGTEIRTRKLDCDPLALTCSAKGFKKGTKKFSQCKTDQAAQYALENQKRANPALGYCIDSGFKTGTEAMAMCMASYNQERHNQFIFERQQDADREAMYQQATQERRQRFDETIRRNNDMLLNSSKGTQGGLIRSAPIYTPPTTTECRQTGFGNVRCETYQ